MHGQRVGHVIHGGVARNFIHIVLFIVQHTTRISNTIGSTYLYILFILKNT